MTKCDIIRVLYLFYQTIQLDFMWQLNKIVVDIIPTNAEIGYFTKFSRRNSNSTKLAIIKNNL